MPDARFWFHQEAVRDAQGARGWYAQRSASAASGFMAELDAALARISQFPSAGPPYIAGTRRRLFHRFPFFVVYRELPDQIQIIAVAHGRRRPGYWRDRLGK